MKINQKILQAINEGIRKSLLSFDDVEFDQSTNTNQKVSKSINDWEWAQANCVDLGLPSGTLWCKCNLGASLPEELGGYYAWGELTTKSEYTVDNYKYSVTDKYSHTSRMDHMDLADDVAHQTDKHMCMPSLQQVKELLDYTIVKGCTLHGVKGKKFISKMDKTKSIFIPYSGYRSDSATHWVDKDGMLWTNTFDKSDSGVQFAAYLNFEKRNIMTSWEPRSNGLQIRPVALLK